jgi:glycosyltransferase involved in cell wall biosynthesis
MKISICIPQYNRINFLLKSLQHIALQSYENIEIVISDDNSSDSTIEVIEKLIKSGEYRYPIIFHANLKNTGFDRNLRKSLELGTGDYLFILGNDDTLNDKDCIKRLVDFLKSNNYPDIGYCNFVEFKNPNEKINRASKTAVIGTGLSKALSYYSSFVNVAGIIIKRSTYHLFNTDKYDGSIYVQMYIAARMILAGFKFFTIEEHMVLSNIVLDGSGANSYRDTLVKKWKDFKQFDGGLPQVIYVVVSALIDSGNEDKQIFYNIIKRIITQSYPNWLLDYRSNNAFVHSVGLALGLYRKKIIYNYHLSLIQIIKLNMWYLIMTIIGLFLPVVIFNKYKLAAYNYLKKRQLKNAARPFTFES